MFWLKLLFLSLVAVGAIVASVLVATLHRAPNPAPPSPLSALYPNAPHVVALALARDGDFDYLAVAWRSPTPTPAQSGHPLPACAPDDAERGCAAVVKFSPFTVLAALVFANVSLQQLAAPITSLAVHEGKLYVAGSDFFLTHAPNLTHARAMPLPLEPSDRPRAFVLAYDASALVPLSAMCVQAQAAEAPTASPASGDPAALGYEIAARTVQPDDRGFAVAVWGSSYSQTWNVATHEHAVEHTLSQDGPHAALVVWIDASHQVARVWSLATSNDPGVTSGVRVDGNDTYLFGSYVAPDENAPILPLYDALGNHVMDMQWEAYLPLVYVVRLDSNTGEFVSRAAVWAISYLPQLDVAQCEGGDLGRILDVAVGACDLEFAQAANFGTDAYTFTDSLPQLPLPPGCSAYAVRFRNHSYQGLVAASSPDADLYLDDLSASCAALRMSFHADRDASVDVVETDELSEPTRETALALPHPGTDRVARALLTLASSVSFALRTALAPAGDVLAAVAYRGPLLSASLWVYDATNFLRL
jgi:hypothetical protein